jgi:hypothetical protein
VDRAEQRACKELSHCRRTVTSSGEEDFVTMALRYRERDGEIHVMRHSPHHVWPLVFASIQVFS